MTQKPIDTEKLLTNTKSNYDFVIDGTHFGRGNYYISQPEQVKYQYCVITLKKWKINENENSLEDLTKSSGIEHFYSSDCYIIYAKFKVIKTDLNTKNAKETDDNKEIFFYWRGWHASKGYSPLPKELNVEDVPVVRTFQWAEPPIFLRLFNGKLIVHNNKNNQSHLYMLCGTVKEEANCIEVPKEKRSLRSRTSFLLVLPQEHQIYIWYGSKAYNKSFFENVLLSLNKEGSSVYGIDNKPFNVTTLNEKESDDNFLAYLEGNIDDYYSLADNLIDYQENSPRLFYFNNITGEFNAIEIEYTLGNEFLNPFPFLQDHLYSAPQPALFLLDNKHELYLWQGWKNKVTTNEELLEFKEQRDYAIETTINYWRASHPTIKENIYLVAAGMEPLQFINIFPFWIQKNELKESFIACDYKHDQISTKYLN